MRILLTGASGNLGQEVFSFMVNSGHAVVAPHHLVSSRTLRALDITDLDSCCTLLASNRFDAIVHLAALTNPELCEVEPERARIVNVEGTRNLLAATNRDCIFLFASTDYVFDGSQPPYSEGDAKAPLNTYGVTKSQAEELVGEIANNSIIMRLPVLYGSSERHESGFLRRALSNVKKRAVVELDDEQVRYPTHFRDVARAVEFLLREHLHGVFHVSSSQAATKYSFAYTLAKILGENSDHLIPTKRMVSGAVRRPHDCMLSTSRFAIAGGPTPQPFSEVLISLVNELYDLYKE